MFRIFCCTFSIFFVILQCGGARSNYLIIPANAAASEETSENAMRIAVMDTVADSPSMISPAGDYLTLSEFRKSVSDALFLTYRGGFPATQVTQIPLDKGLEVIVWGAEPVTTENRTFIIWRVEFLKDGKLLGELSVDIPVAAGGDFESILAGSLAEAVRGTHRGHMKILKTIQKAAAPEKKFLTRGKIFKAQGNSLIVAIRPDYPVRSGQILDIVDTGKKNIGKLKVGSVYHTNFQAELLSGRAMTGSEVGAFVR